jgi:hypothetical protein
MRPLLLLGVLALLAGGTAPAVAKQYKYLVTMTVKSDGRPESQAAGGGDYLQARVAEEIVARYPCATVMTMDEAKTLIGWQRFKDLLGAGSPEELKAIADAMNVDYIVSLTLTELPGAYIANGVQTSVANTRATARGNSPRIAEDGNEASGLEQFARDFAKSVTGPNCDPNPWTGTITYSRNWERNTEETRSGTKYVEQNRWSMEYTVQIPEKGKPKLTVKYAGTISGERSWSYELSCRVGPNRGIGAKFAKKTGEALDGSQTEKSGSATLPVDVTFTESTTELRITVLEANFATTAVNTVKEVRTAACDDKPINRETKGEPALGTLDTFPPSIPGLPLRPGLDHLQGRFPPTDRAQPSMGPATKEVTLTTWDLQRVRKNSTSKK